VARKARDTLTAYQAKLDDAITKCTEAEGMKKYITTAVDGAQGKITDINTAFESAEGHTSRARTLSQAMATSLTTFVDLARQVDETVNKTLQMSATDGNLTWAIDGSKQAKTNFEGVETEKASLYESVDNKIGLADTHEPKVTMR